MSCVRSRPRPGCVAAEQGYRRAIRATAMRDGGYRGRHDGSPVVLVHGWGGSFASTWQTQRVHRAARRRRPRRHRRRPARSRHRPEAARARGLRRPHRPGARGDARRRPSTRSASRSARSPCCASRSTSRTGSASSCSPASAATCSTTTPGHRARSSPRSRAAATRPTTTSLACSPQYAQPARQRPARRCTAVMKRPRGVPFTAERSPRVTCPTLVVIGDQDFAGPGDPLAAALPDAHAEGAAQRRPLRHARVVRLHRRRARVPRRDPG